MDENIIQDLLTKSTSAFNKGDLDQAVAFLDQVITIYETLGVPSFALKIHREMLIGTTRSASRSKIAAIMKQAIDYFRKRDNRFQQVEYLIDLASVTSYDLEDHILALRYLDESNQILDSLPSEYILKLIQMRRFSSEEGVRDITSAVKRRITKERRTIEDRQTGKL